jgi:hypothetical protein
LVYNPRQSLSDIAYTAKWLAVFILRGSNDSRRKDVPICTVLAADSVTADSVAARRIITAKTSQRSYPPKFCVARIGDAAKRINHAGTELCVWGWGENGGNREAVASR